MAEDIGKSAVRGIAWTGAGQALRQVIGVVTSVTLARLLAPEDFGVMGMASVAMAFAQLFSDYGIGAALVQAQENDEQTLSTAFWANAMLAVILYGLLLVAAPFVADFFNTEQVAQVIIVVGMVLLLSPLTSVPRALLFQRLDFRSVARAQVLGSLIAAVAAISLAFSGFGVWSLAAQPVVGTAATLAFTWSSSAFWPKLVFRWANITQHIRFSTDVLGSNVMNYFARNADNIIIGRVLGTQPLANYALAYQIMLYPLSQVSSVVVRVLFPTLSKLQDDIPRFQKAYLQAVSAVALITMPMMVGLFVTAPEFIVVVLGEKWMPALPVVEILCWVGMFQSVGTTVGSVFLSTGNTRLLFRITLVATLVTVPAFLIGVQWGVTGVAAAYAIVNTIIVFFIIHIAMTLIGGNGWRMANELKGPLLSALAMGAVVAMLRSTLIEAGIDAVAVLVLTVVTGIAAYLLFSLVLNREQLLNLYGRFRELRAK